MARNLQRQVHLYSLDTSAFYNEEEQVIHRKLMKSYNYRSKLRKMKGIPNKRVAFVTKRIGKLKSKLKAQIKKNENVRCLNPEYLRSNNKISSFESTLTRVLNIKEDTLTEEIFVIRAYYFDILKELISDGFLHNGEKYVYFSSSAGQIRTKKGVWIKEASWNKYKNTLTCGLSVESINNQGGSNVNKYLAYMALTNGATSEWKDFDISKTIVVDDLETNVRGVVDYIDRNTYKIDRKDMEIPIEHTDGCGIMLPNISEKSFMVRLPFIKGLLSPFNFRSFVNEFGGSHIVKDIYGKEWDIFKDDIQIIFTKSQFKMHEYYQDWDEYKDNFVKYNCQASKLNEESDEFPEVTLTYQMIQTLTDISEDELYEISESTIEDILDVGSDKETMLRLIGATGNNKNKNHFQQALYLYPELLNDTHAKNVIKDVKRSLVKNARSGKINISGKYTYLIPDLFAFCERIFLGKERPLGLLENGEVYCKAFEFTDLDILRSPHLYREQGVRRNIGSEKLGKWFTTNGIYTSIHDTISKMLQFDNDGDTALVIDDPTFVSVAKRNMKGIVPLYYEMEKSNPQYIDQDSIYESLILAFRANIGEVSNNITKIWNSPNPDLDVIKWLCMENNFIIDYAKTLFMPTRPNHINKRIREYTKGKTPHFFIDAKNKEEHKVEPINDSPVNKLNYIIPDKRIHFKKVAGAFDHRMLMRNPRARNNQDIINRYSYLIRRKKRYMNNREDIKEDGEVYFHKFIKNELLKISNNEVYITDVLVRYLYAEKPNNSKTQLWASFGGILVDNLKKNIDKLENCSDCGRKFLKSRHDQVRCSKCTVVKNKEVSRNLMRKKRASKQV